MLIRQILTTLVLSSIIWESSHGGPPRRIPTTLQPPAVHNEFTTHINWRYVPTNCGIKKMTPASSERVWPGQEVEFGEFPWLAGIYKNRYDLIDGKPVCMGSIISNHFVLTGGHCCKGNPAAEMLVQIGGFSLNRTNPGCILPLLDPNHPGQSTSSDCYAAGRLLPVYPWNLRVIHKLEYYFDEGVDGETPGGICLIKTTNEIPFDDAIQPICLPFYSQLLTPPYYPPKVLVAGWGETYEGANTWEGKNTTVLLKEWLPVVASKVCRDTFSQVTPVKEPQYICAGGRMDGRIRRFCDGDQGGPLMVLYSQRFKPRWHTLGIITQVEREPLVPGGYPYTCVLSEDRPNLAIRLTTPYLHFILDHLR